MEINKRITKVIEDSKLTPSEFADKIDVQRSSISHIASGRNKPSLEFIIKIKSAFPDLEWDWLISGNGPMIKELELPPLNEVVEKEKKVSLPDLFSLIDDDSFGYTENEDIIKNTIPPESKNIEAYPALENISDSQRLEIPLNNDAKTQIKKTKRIVFFYEDGSFETFEN